jgi:hypothetical protein
MRLTARAALVATVVMLVVGGTTAAASHLLTGSDIKSHSISLSDLSVKQRALQGPPGPPGPSVLGRLTRVEASKDIPPGGVDSIAVGCPAGLLQ